MLVQQSAFETLPGWSSPVMVAVGIVVALLVLSVLAASVFGRSARGQCGPSLLLPAH